MKVSAIRRWFLGIALITFAFVLYLSQHPSAHLPLPVPVQRLLYRGQAFAPFSIQLVDNVTSRPVDGAELQLVCMGGTPYEKALYQTDMQGRAQVMGYLNSSILFLKVNVPGYKPATATVFTNKPVAQVALIPL